MPIETAMRDTGSSTSLLPRLDRGTRSAAPRGDRRRPRRRRPVSAAALRALDADDRRGGRRPRLRRPRDGRGGRRRRRARRAGPTGQVLVERGVLRHDQLARVVAERFGLDYVDLTVYDLDMGAVNLIRPRPPSATRRSRSASPTTARCCWRWPIPTNVLTIDDVAMMTGRRVRVAAASVEDLNLLLTRLARMDDSIEDIVDEEPDAEAEAGRARRRGRPRRAGHQAGALDRRPGGPAGRLRHPRQPRRGRHARAVPRRRRARPGGDDQAQDGGERRLARSRSWATSTSPRSACPRTAASR